MKDILIYLLMALNTSAIIIIGVKILCDFLSNRKMDRCYITYIFSADETWGIGNDVYDKKVITGYDILMLRLYLKEKVQMENRDKKISVFIVNWKNIKPE